MKTMCTVSYEEIISEENLLEAWREFLVGKRSKVDVQLFTRHLADEIYELSAALQTETYVHGPYTHFTISDPKPRDIHKASVRDRLVHHALHRQLYPFFARTFMADSFSCQTGKGLHKALARYDVTVRRASRNFTQTAWVLQCDIRKFFASVDQQVLLNILTRSIADQRVINLLRIIIESFAVATGKGIPLGNLTSQLFSNIILNELDQFLKHRLQVKHYLRYADDFLIVSQDYAWLRSLILPMEHFLTDHLSLHLHPKKLSVKTVASGVDFLGWVHFPTHRVLRTSTRHRVFKNIRNNPKPATLASYLGLLSHGDTCSLQQELLNTAWIHNN